MSDFHTGGGTAAAARFCPKCSSALITVPELITIIPTTTPGSVNCGACGWTGSSEDLVVAPFKHQMGDDGQVLQAMVTDLRNRLGKDIAKTLGSFLMKWGFITPGVTPQELSKYIVAAAKALMTSILDTRREIELERHRGPNDRN